jgi:hypothetical protein
MSKIPECDRCRFNLRNPYLVCHDYPAGPPGNSCLHFAPDPDAKPEELWEPEGASYYNGELILQPRQRWTRSVGFSFNIPNRDSFYSFYTKPIKPININLYSF